MEFGRILMLIYAVILFGGGYSAYVVKHSVASLVASSISGLLLVVAFFLSGQQPKAGYLLSGGVALVLVAVMGYRAIKAHTFMPAGGVAALSLVMALLFLLFWKNAP